MNTASDTLLSFRGGGNPLNWGGFPLACPGVAKQRRLRETDWSTCATVPVEATEEVFTGCHSVRWTWAPTGPFKSSKNFSRFTAKIFLPLPDQKGPVDGSMGTSPRECHYQSTHSRRIVAVELLHGSQIPCNTVHESVFFTHQTAFQRKFDPSTSGRVMSVDPN